MGNLEIMYANKTKITYTLECLESLLESKHGDLSIYTRSFKRCSPINRLRLGFTLLKNIDKSFMWALPFDG